ncbi:MAG: hypothetical protein AVDCRST_MAG59-2887 [uncultured Thermomicrobiales bacterium]|uniref:Uncharacterized protein n=1 Tax=uncultured Thermomicrobiales bacterium TaxID=1645740 RepID=A0A6J4V0M6_9BACT|nr:MAG: hypothetical protein AVDCRST_MAG59-2887 [uncultured Thermomicrobiales bacterium]
MLERPCLRQRFGGRVALVRAATARAPRRDASGAAVTRPVTTAARTPLKRLCPRFIAGCGTGGRSACPSSRAEPRDLVVSGSRTRSLDAARGDEGSSSPANRCRA